MIYTEEFTKWLAVYELDTSDVAVQSQITQAMGNRVRDILPLYEKIRILGPEVAQALIIAGLPVHYAASLKRRDYLLKHWHNDAARKRELINTVFGALEVNPAIKHGKLEFKDVLNAGMAWWQKHGATTLIDVRDAWHKMQNPPPATKRGKYDDDPLGFLFSDNNGGK